MKGAWMPQAFFDVFVEGAAYMSIDEIFHQVRKRFVGNKRVELIIWKVNEIITAPQKKKDDIQVPSSTSTLKRNFFIPLEDQHHEEAIMEAQLVNILDTQKAGLVCQWEERRRWNSASECHQEQPTRCQKKQKMRWRRRKKKKNSNLI